MTNLGIVNTKGGVGKTTTAIMLGAAGAYRGHPVNIVDTDQQGSASAWISQVATTDGEAPVELTIANMATLSTLPDDRINIIDTPPGNPGLIDRVIAISDLVVIPTTPSLGDIERVWQTLKIIPPSTPHAVLLTQVNSQAILARQMRDVLDEDGVMVFPDSIPRREAFRKIFGTWPDNDARQMLGYDDTFDQIMEVLA